MFKQVVLVLTATLLMATGPFVTAFSQNTTGGYDYEPTAVILMVELVKLLVSVVGYAILPENKRSHRLLSARDVVRFAIPALVYALNNNLLFLILQHIKPSIFQLLSATKAMFTALLFRLLLRRRLSATQYIAIAVLAGGAAVSRLSSRQEESQRSTEALGVLLTLVSCVASSFGGVTNEVLLKREGAFHHLTLQNSLLYVWGVIFNGGAFLITTRASTPPWVGYNARVGLLIATTSATGLSISIVLKLLDNLVRVLAHAAATLISLCIETAVARRLPQAELVLAIWIVSFATILYARETPPQPISSRQAIVGN